MRVLIVAESCFGNTRTIARTIATGLARSLASDAITVARPSEAPLELRSDLDLLLVGAPTHDYSLPKEQTRNQAVKKGATIDDGTGIKEWIGRLTPRADLWVMTFDTSIEMRFTLGSASKAAYKALKRRGFQRAERGESFYVGGTTGPLLDGEQARAEAWGTELAASLRR